VDMVGDYKAFFEQAGLSQGGSGPGNMGGGAYGESKSLEDLFYQKEMDLSKLVFTRQFTHAAVYAWVKLKEQVSGSRPRAAGLTAATLEQDE
jgi:V-type H+-transporting ATPase subunit d